MAHQDQQPHDQHANRPTPAPTANTPAASPKDDFIPDSTETNDTTESHEVMPHRLGTMTERWQARLERVRADYVAARAAYAGDCYDCQDTGRGPNDLPCPHCARGEAVRAADEAAYRESAREHLFAEGGVPRRRWTQTFASYPDQDHRTLALVRAFAETWDGKRGLVLIGDYGVGKTGLIVALVRALATRYQMPRIPNLLPTSVTTARPVLAYYTTMDLIDSLRGGFTDGSYAHVLTRAKNARILVLDDLGVEIPTDWVRERLFSIINTRYEAELPIFATSNYGAEQLEAHLGTRIFARLFESCDVIEMHGRDLRTSAADADDADVVPGDGEDADDGR